ncbi:NAD-dependent deacylase [Salipiger mangrovisoli]|uniref:NAD-dependent protein deacylase n=1 Tax=Salipiger mangrovisoli TaxID=2865933 RepID=A0ABR9X8V2_9RHOB|nr:NAD-dependent deacylase [Salipiger mangrovisoli]MBE9639892.1 NAD-dependent deacylase [Salipiger mangrovisoli]
MSAQRSTAEKIVILTGAGISAESGLGTFRDEGGLWAQHRIEDVATPEGFARNPKLVHDFYNARRAQAAVATPNAAHSALARLQRDHPGEVILVTQNVDGLHEKAGATALHMHGVLDGALCAACGGRWTAPLVMSPSGVCPHCDRPATRPDIVWFGEMPYFMDEIAEHLETCDLFAAIGTSGQVYPAAGFVQEAAYAGAHTVELNLSDSDTSRSFAEHRVGPASRIVPQWVEEILAAKA